MIKTIEKNETGVNCKGSIEEYLINTYGKEKMDRVQRESINGGSSYTHLDIIGYTLDKSGYEMQDRNGNGYGDEYGYKDYYELNEMEDMMVEKWDEKNVGSEDQS